MDSIVQQLSVIAAALFGLFLLFGAACMITLVIILLRDNKKHRRPTGDTGALNRVIRETRERNPTSRGRVDGGCYGKR